MYVAGRTDAGVHAISNCIHVDIQRKHKKTKEIIVCLYLINISKLIYYFDFEKLEPFDPIIVQKAINRNLYKKTKDVYITSSQLVSEVSFKISSITINILNLLIRIFMLDFLFR